ncbi:unnamed protein product [Diabrotica balteata]|uniref:L-serine ammonia-lyase n=1 Tax=Diabrotica balteata TaxID=107213 RepID=A0A9N9XA76_DIABA|nr:unnamed protein product [Diabrotica balteata]
MNLNKRDDCFCEKSILSKQNNPAVPTTTIIPRSTVNADDIANIDAIEEVKDEFCNPDSPVIVSFEDVKKAEEAIKDGVVHTPFARSYHLSKMFGMEIYLKYDFKQITGSFKDRGARYACLNLTEDQRKAGVITASAGNHAQAMSYHAASLGVPVTVVMPITSPIMKITKCRDYGANVILKGNHYGESRKVALYLAKKHNMVFINGYDHPNVIAGQGSVGMEICRDLPDVDVVVVPTGGAGLLSGICVAVKGLNPQAKIIAVEAARAAGFKNAMDNGKPTDTPILPSLADGLSVPCIGYNAFATARNHVEKVISLKENCIALGILRLVEMEKVVVEGSGASGVAAILGGHLDEYKGKKIAIVLSGGNIDTSVLGRVLERGLAADGRYIKVKVLVRDRAGGVAELLADISDLGICIKHVMHERAWVTSDVYSVSVKCILETRDYQHSLDLKEALERKYGSVEFVDFPSTPPGTVPC